MQRRTFLERCMAVVVAVPIVSLLFARREPPEEAKRIWTTREGRQVRICDMTDDHLRNCIFFLNKVYGYNHPDRIMGGTPSDLTPMYDIMRREAERRHLSWI